MFEYITLLNQRSSGFEIGNISTTIRALKTEGTPSAVRLIRPSAHLVLLDSQLNAEAGTEPAIDAAVGSVFAARVQTSGFPYSIRIGGSASRQETIHLYATGGLQTTRPGDAFFLPPIEELPLFYFNPDSAGWAAPTAPSGEALEAAFQSGADSIYLPSAESLSASVEVPATVRAIHGLMQENRIRFIVKEDSDQPLFVYDIEQGRIENRSNRTIVTNNTQWTRFEGAGKWFLNNVGQGGIEDLRNADVHVRWANQEGRRNLIIQNSRWIQMGHKTEHQDNGVIQISGAESQVAIFGSTVGVSVDGPVLLVDDGATVTYVGSNSADYRGSDAIIDQGHSALNRDIFHERREGGRYIFSYSTGTLNPETPGKDKL